MDKGFYRLIRAISSRLSNILYWSRLLRVSFLTQGYIRFNSKPQIEKYCIFIHKEGRMEAGKSAKIREFCKINLNGGQLEIGDNFFLNAYSSINCRKSIKIGDNVLIGEAVHIYDHDHDYRQPGPVREQGFKEEPIEIGDNVWIGSGCLILKGAKIGSNSVIGANSVVRSDVPADSLFYNQHDPEIVNISRK